MMNILFLDDSHTRHDFICKTKHAPHVAGVCKSASYSIYHAYRVGEFISFFEACDEYFDLVHLDHDLSVVKKEELNGVAAAKYLADNYEKYKERVGKIVIHSWNTPGSKNIEAILIDVGYEDVLISPFSVA